MKASQFIILVIAVCSSFVVVGIVSLLATSRSNVLQELSLPIGGTASTGGPDHAGYTFLDSTEPGGPSYTWEDISTSGTEISVFLPNNDDGYSQPITIPFAFPFYREVYTRTVVGTNGYLIFGGTSYKDPGYSLPSPGVPNNIIVPFGGDMQVASGVTHIYTETKEYPTRMIIQFDGLEPLATPGMTSTFQVVLYQDGNVLIRYKDVQATPHVVGLENADGTDGLSYPPANLVGGNIAVMYFAPGQQCFVNVNGVMYYQMQEAIDAASDGDVIKVAGNCRGVGYREGISQTVYISKPITLSGGYTRTNWHTPDPDIYPTTLDAQDSGRVLVVSGTNGVVVDGLRLTGGNAVGLGGGPGVSDAGGGVYAINATLSLTASEIVSNHASYGGGVYLFNSPATLDRVIVSANSVTGTGGGLFLHRSDALLSNVLVADNQAQIIASALAISDSSPSLLHATIARNTGGDGSGVVLSGSSGEMDTASFTNTILFSHTLAISATAGQTATLHRVLCRDNTTDWNGSGAVVTTTAVYTRSPEFVNPGQGDYRLKALSEAIDRGDDVGVGQDLDGYGRPAGEGPDLGAFEYPLAFRFSQQATPDPLYAGSPITYTLLVENTGVVSFQAVLTDTLPTDVTPSDQKTWTIGPVAPGQVWTEDVVVSVNEQYEGPLDNLFEGSITDGSHTAYTSTQIISQTVAPRVQFERSSYSGTEGDPKVLVSVIRTGPALDPVSVDYKTADDSAVAGYDYGSVEGRLTFLVGETRRTFEVPLNEDTTVEGTENIRVALSNVTGNALLGSPYEGSITITDNDLRAGGVLQFSQERFFRDETDANHTVSVPVERTTGTSGTVRVDYRTIQRSGTGAATPGRDYRSTSGTLEFVDGDSQKKIPIDILGDRDIEGSEWVILEISNPTGLEVQLGAQQTAVLVIDDNDVDSRGVIQFTREIYEVDEGASVNIPIERDGGTFGDASVRVEFVDGTAIEGIDYGRVERLLEFEDGNPYPEEKVIPIDLSNYDNHDVDGTRYLTLRFVSGSVSGATEGSQREAILIINDDEKVSKGVFEFSEPSIIVDEGDTTQTYSLPIVDRVGGSSGSVSVSITSSDGTATVGSDYDDVSTTKHFGDGQYDSQSVDVTIHADDKVEGSETFYLTLRSKSPGTELGAQKTIKVIVRDNDTDGAGVLEFAETSKSFNETDSTVTGTVPVHRVGGSHGVASVTVETVATGSAEENADFLPKKQTIVFSDGDVSPQDVPIIELLGDDIPEGCETFKLLLRDANGADLGSQREMIIVINDDEELPAGIIQWHIPSNPLVFDEEIGQVIATIERIGGIQGNNVTVDVDTVGVTATEGDDFVGIHEQHTFSGSNTIIDIPITVHKDSDVESSEQFEVRLDSPTGEAQLGTHSVITFTIQDNDMIPPGIISHPESQEIPCGGSVTLDVNANGSELNYQWYRGISSDTSDPIVGATSANYATTPPCTGASSYWVRVSNNAGPVNSNAAVVTVREIPIITRQPAGQQVSYGDMVELCVEATSTTPLSYQWYEGMSDNTDNLIQQATGSCYTTNSLYQDTHFWVGVSNGTDVVDSDTATITVVWLPTITKHPTGETVEPGGEITLEVVAEGKQPLSYQWYEVIGEQTSTPVDGETQPTFILKNINRNTSYWVEVSNEDGRALSNAASIRVNGSPEITQQPESVTIEPNTSTTLDVVATGTELHYQWEQQNSDGSFSAISGATNPQYTTVALSENTSYRVLVENDYGETVSDIATVTINGSPIITSQPDDQAINKGETATLEVEAIGDAPLSYQWEQQNSDGSFSAISGATNPQYTTAVLSENTSYRVLVENNYGEIVSDIATVTINGMPVIITHPASQQVGSPGDVITLTVEASGTLPLHYQWEQQQSDGNCTSVAGETTSQLVVSINEQISYRVRVHNSVGSIKSDLALITLPGAPVIVMQPSDKTINRGESTTLHVKETGFSPRNYQWYQGPLGDTSFPVGPNSETFDTPQLSNDTSYWVRVSNDAGWVDSREARITVIAPPEIVSQSSDRFIGEGMTARLEVVANGSDLSYQWYRGNSGDMSDPVGSNAPTYTTPPISSEDSVADHYWVRVNNNVSHDDSDTIHIIVFPAIVEHPRDTMINSGESAELCVTVRGHDPFTYEWYKVGDEGTILRSEQKNEREDCYTTPEMWVDAGYRVRVSNDATGYDKESDTATISLRVAPYDVRVNITPSPPIDPDTSVTLDATASGDKPFTCTWYKGEYADDSNEIQQGSCTYTTTSLVEDTNYWVRMSNAAGSDDSNTVTIAVREPPEIIIQPEEQSIGRGERATLAVEVTGTSPFSYQWQLQNPDGSFSDIDGATDRTYTTPPLYEDTSYRVWVENDVGVTLSEVATVTVWDYGVEIVGPSEGCVRKPMTFTAIVEDDLDQKGPSYTWFDSENRSYEGKNVHFQWGKPGTKTITVEVRHNSKIAAIDSHTVEIDVCLEGVEIEGASTIHQNEWLTLTAKIIPPDTTPPIRYCWDAEGHQETCNTNDPTIKYQWSITGTKHITVTARAGGNAPVTATHAVQVGENIPMSFGDGEQFEVWENEGQAIISVTLKSAAESRVEVRYSAFDGTATASQDYRPVLDILTFPPGTEVMTFSIPLIDDKVYEGDETVLLSLHEYAGATPCGINVATLVIKENDLPPSDRSVFQIEQRSYEVDEGETVHVKVICTGKCDDRVRVRIDAFDGTAKSRYNSMDGVRAGIDYNMVGEFLTFAPGDREKEFLVETKADQLTEGIETVRIVLSNPDGEGKLGSLREAILHINDEQLPGAQGIASFGADEYHVYEGKGGEEVTEATITLNRMGNLGSSLTLSYATFEGTASHGSDFKVVTGTVTFAPGDAVTNFTVPVYNNNTVDGYRTVNLILRDVPREQQIVSLAASGEIFSPVAMANVLLSNETSRLNTQHLATLIIEDDETVSWDGQAQVVNGACVFQFPDLTYSVKEDGEYIEVPVQGENCSGVETVEYWSEENGAKPGEDYIEIEPSGTLTFTGESQRETFPVIILDDGRTEGDEIIYLQLSREKCPSKKGCFANLIIVDDEDPGILSIEAKELVNQRETMVCTIEAIVERNDDKPIAGQRVNFTSEDDGVFPRSGTTDAEGKVTIPLSSTVAGTVRIDVAADNAATSVDCVFTPARLNLARLVQQGPYWLDLDFQKVEPGYIKLSDKEDVSLTLWVGFLPFNVSKGNFNGVAFSASQGIFHGGNPTDPQETNEDGEINLNFVSSSIDRRGPVVITTTVMHTATGEEIEYEGINSTEIFFTGEGQDVELLPGLARRKPPGAVEVRTYLEAVVWDALTGMPERYPVPGETIDFLVDDEKLWGIEPSAETSSLKGTATVELVCGDNVGTPKVTALWSDDEDEEYYQCGTPDEVAVAIQDAETLFPSEEADLAYRLPVNLWPFVVKATVEGTNIHNQQVLFAVDEVLEPGYATGFARDRDTPATSMLTNPDLISGTVQLKVRAGPREKIVDLFFTPTSCDERNENDSMAQAWSNKAVLPDDLPLQYRGQACLGGFAEEHDTNDYFRFNLTRYSLVRIWLRGIPEGADYAVQIISALDPALSLRMSDNPGNMDEALLDLHLPPGTYYIQVYRGEDGRLDGTYSLAVFTTPLE